MATIRIRAPEVSDADALSEVFSCPGVIAGTLQLPFRSLEFSRERLAQQSPSATANTLMRSRWRASTRNHGSIVDHRLPWC